MKHALLLFFIFVGFSLASLAQEERVISGTLLDDSGSPIPGVTVMIKGTSIGTVSNVDGYYEIKAPIGSTLVFSSVGFSTQELLVTKENASNNEINRSTRTDSLVYDYSKTMQLKDSLGRNNSRNIGILKDNSPKYTLPDMYWQQNAKIIRLPTVYKINLAGISNDGKTLSYAITTQPTYYNHYEKDWRVSFLSAFSLQTINQLPDLQNTYAQGSPLGGESTWQGPETGEVFSWGPALNSLEYQGDAYPYDRNGSLTEKGNGNGQEAKAYDPLDFLRQAHQWHNSLQLSKDFGIADIYAKLHYNRQNHIMPESNSEQVDVSLKNRWNIGSLRIQSSLNYQNTNHQLPIVGSNWQTILGAVYRTPISFDNANGLSRKDALENVSSYQLANGTPRSHSPLQVDNPFALVSTLPDEKKERNWRANIKLYHQLNNVELNHQLGFESQNEQKQFGLLPSSIGTPEGRFTDREYKTSRFFFKTLVRGNALRYNVYDHSLWLNFQYQLNHEGHQLNRLDAFGFLPGAGFDPEQASRISLIEFDKNRFAHQITGKITWEGFNQSIKLDLENQIYVSSTLQKDDWAFFQPAAALRLQFGRLLNKWNVPVISEIKLFAVYSHSIQEAPIVYNQWHFNSTLSSSSDYAAYYEAQEILLENPLNPEKYHKLDLGLEISLSHNLDLNLNFFHNRTLDMLVPVFRDDAFILDNVADLRNRGWEIQFSTFKYFYLIEDINWKTQLSFSRYNPVVTDLKGAASIPLSGYQDISSQLIQGQPWGVLVGSRYLRNNSGQQIIDDNGYPLVDPNPQVLGNPNPDFILSWYNQFSSGDFSWSFTLEYRHGGDIWNGTQQALNYLGRSQLSADQRDITGFVFPGVQTNNNPNQTPVDFANPAGGLESNRWVRYGWIGVGEDAIQKASWLRLSEIKFSYDFTQLWKGLIPRGEAKLSIYAKNILLYAPYSGIDPSTSLLDYRQSAGLDLFNSPGTRSYGLQVELKF